MYVNIDRIVSKFKNGEERYKTSPTFNKTVQMLARGASPYEIIDVLCQMADDNQKVLMELMLREPPSMHFIHGSVNPEEFEKTKKE